MTHSKTWPLAPADDTDTITSAELVDIDNKTVSAPDFTNGGSYSPTSPVIVSNNGLKLGGTDKLQLNSRSLTVAQTAPKINAIATMAIGWAGVTVTTGDVWTQDLLVPHGATITSITVYIDPANDALPTTNAQVQFRKHNAVTNTTTTINTTTDPNTGASYQDLHGFGPTGMSEVVDRSTTSYFVVMIPEAGGDLDPYTWSGTTVTYTLTAQDDRY